MLRPTRLDYCRYLLSTPINYTLTHFAEHCESLSHDQLNRYLAGDRLMPRMLWEHVKDGDGKSKLDHVRDMLSVSVYLRDIAFSTVLISRLLNRAETGVVSTHE